GVNEPATTRISTLSLHDALPISKGDDTSTSGSGKSSPTSIVQRLKEMDEQRPSFPGEHWLVFAAGAFLMAKAARQRSFITQSLMLTAGSALIGRAASGRYGLIKVASQVMGRRRF